MTLGRVVQELKYGLEEYACCEFNEKGIDLLIEQKREEFRWEFNIYLEGENIYDN